MMTLGDKLSRLRKERNYTQEQLADLLKVSRQSISKWESDLVYPETEKLIELGKLFDCSMDYLLKENVTEKTGTQQSTLKEKLIKIRQKLQTEENRCKVRKVLKIAGIVFAVMLIADVISMILYFAFLGVPY